ncbi:signal peptidase II [Desemzia incerta]|uniref:Lipoprotein signal peptidase n=1 Tax=Marinilactibacillus piezotolerans TaxID=258723 RepID=A0A1I3ZPA3_9LACT|nr:MULTISPECIES: signal peptidase II [Carnobacteriaceae]WHZ32523.1 signal peptidase II [Desemzia incerta]SFK45521.1 signal peptidase II [Marinilactibacillus piezotolerans]
MILYYLLAAVLIAIDQMVKWKIVQNFSLYDELEVIPEFFSLYYIQNRGAAWGILPGRMGFFFIITILIVGYLIYTFHNLPQKSILSGISFSFILAGALGNFIDRMRLGYVIDMFRFDFIDFPIFNVADVFLTIGVGTLMVYLLFFEKEEGIASKKGLGK